jgi:hypothetical protein
MRFFELLNYQHMMGSMLIPIIFMVLFAVGLSFMPLVSSIKKKNVNEETHQFNDGIKEDNNPFPLIMALIISGTVLWAVFYIFYYGFSEVTI